MSEEQAEFVLLVLDISTNYYKRQECEDQRAAEAANTIAARYEELKGALDFESAMKKAQSEFLTSLTSPNLKLKFRELSVGAKFKYPGSSAVWVVMEAFGNGLVAEWKGVLDEGHQSICCFVDGDWTLDSEVEVVG